MPIDTNRYKTPPARSFTLKDSAITVRCRSPGRGARSAGTGGPLPNSEARADLAMVNIPPRVYRQLPADLLAGNGSE